jgi:hypothetical protein
MRRRLVFTIAAELTLGFSAGAMTNAFTLANQFIARTGLSPSGLLGGIASAT